MSGAALRLVAMLLALLPATLASPARGAAQSVPLLLAPMSVQPGGAVRVAFYGHDGLRGASALLLDATGRPMSRGAAFAIDLGLAARPLVALLGVPTTAEAGLYRLEVSIEDGRGATFTETRLVTVTARSFRDTRLPLDRALTALREEDGPRKRAEARRLSEILSGFDASSLYETGRFIMPLERSRPTSRFGDRRRYEYFDGSVAGTIHAGIDLAAPAGSPVAASGAGRVAFAGSWLVSGNTVVIEHLPGVFSLYYHLDTLAVHNGQLVTRGQLLGTVGSTGLATGPHLHWEVRVGGVAVDPQSFVEEGLVEPEKIRHSIRTYDGLETERG